MINKAQYAKVGSVKIDEGLRLSFDGSRFCKGPKDNFIFNGKIEKKCSNGRYNQVLVEIHYKNLDNEEGFWDTKMVNAVLDTILADIDNWIINYYKSESSSKWEAGLELYQNMRNEFFGSKLVVDNTDNLNTPDTLENVNRVVNVIKEYLNNYMPSYLDQFGDCVITVYWDMFSENDMKMLIENKKFALAVRDMLLSDNIILDKSGFLVYNDGVYLTVDYNKLVAMCTPVAEAGVQNQDNTDDLNSPDALEGPDAFIGFENASEDGDGDLYVSGNEGCCKIYFDDNAPMVYVYGTLMNKMNEEILKNN